MQQVQPHPHPYLCCQWWNSLSPFLLYFSQHCATPWWSEWETAPLTSVFRLQGWLSPESSTQCRFPSVWMKGRVWIRWEAVTLSFSVKVWTSDGLKGQYKHLMKYFLIKFCIHGQRREFHTSWSLQGIFLYKMKHVSTNFILFSPLKCDLY